MPKISYILSSVSFLPEYLNNSLKIACDVNKIFAFNQRNNFRKYLIKITGNISPLMFIKWINIKHICIIYHAFYDCDNEIVLHVYCTL